MVSKAREDLPEPESPVNTTSWSRGISTSIFLRLCSRAPRIAITRASGRLRAPDLSNRSSIKQQCRRCEEKKAVPARTIMAGSVNKVILVGNLGADPEIRRTQDGRPIANLRVATSENWRDKASGERRERTEWHRVVIFSEGLAKIAEQYLKKGAKVYLEGQLQTRKWTDQQGIERYSTEVVLQGF